MSSSNLIEYFTTIDKATPQNDIDNNIVFLDRHNVTCGNKPMTEFRLIHDENNKWQYVYKCADVADEKISNYSTPLNEISSGQSWFLDRHDVNCNNKPLTGFNFVRDGNSDFHYNYTCGNSNLQNIETKLTPPADAGQGAVWFLDRHNVDCGNKVLSEFKLASLNNNQIQYQYTCGDLPPSVAPTNPVYNGLYPTPNTSNIIPTDIINTSGNPGLSIISISVCCSLLLCCCIIFIAYFYKTSQQ